MGSDFLTLGANYRAESERALHRAIAFAVILVFAHLLDVRPTEFSAFTIKISFKDPAIIYGGISLVFGYYLSRWLSQSELGESLYPLHVPPKRMRANLRLARRSHSQNHRNKRKTLTPKSQKSSARGFIIAGNIILLPYRITATLFVLAALIFMAGDLYSLAVLAIAKSNVWTNIMKAIG